MTRDRESYLITGGAGFIGSHLAERLLILGKRVDVLDDLSTGSWQNIRHLAPNPNFRFAQSSVLDAVVLDRLASQADVIIHLAAAVGVQLIVNHPVKTIETNVSGTEAVLKAALRYRSRILIASTSEVYGKGTAIPFREEDDVLVGATSKKRWAYATSKMVDEFLGLAYYQEFGAPVTIARLFNTAGPRQTGRYGMVIPRFISQALSGQNITVYGDGSQSRCFCDVRDVVRALVALSEHSDSVGLVFNVGSAAEITILDLAKKIREKTSSESKVVHVSYDEAYEPGFEDMRCRVPDISRVNLCVGWMPEWSLDQTLESILDDLKKSQSQPSAK